MNEPVPDALLKLRKELGDFWGVSWQTLLGLMQSLALTEETRQELVLLVLGYIQRMMITGNFRNLDGVVLVMDYLGMEDVRPTEEWCRLLVEFDERYDLGFLYDMSPGLRNGKLWDGREYHRVQYVRELLKKESTPPEHLTDSYIESLWRMRETLIRFKSTRRGQLNPNTLSMRELLKLL